MSCERAVYFDEAPGGCGAGGTQPVCSRPAGHSAQGLCDLAGNAAEWVMDWFGPYAEAPDDGSPRTEQGTATWRVFRGGSWDAVPRFMNSTFRSYNLASRRFAILGFRLARAVEPVGD